MTIVSQPRQPTGVVAPPCGTIGGQRRNLRLMCKETICSLTAICLYLQLQQSLDYLLLDLSFLREVFVRM